MENICKTENQRSADEVVTLAKRQFKDHGLDELGWTFGFNKAKRGAGVCRFTKKRIELSEVFALKASQKDLLNTILHEIAHALAGKSHDHDKTWKDIAIRVGCDGKRCHTIKFAEAKIIQFCNCQTRELYKRPTSCRMICGKCKVPVQWKYK
jgi:predicted SprT family Zn-dependent metalloprotease